MAVVGEVDLANAADFLAQMKAVGASGNHFVVDISGLHYIDTTGIRALIDAFRAFKQSKLRMSVAAPTPTVMKVMKILGAFELVPVFDTLADAMRDLENT
jgi:anti-anti-sigma factor